MMNGLHRVLEDVMQGQNKLEEIINLSLSGRNFSTPELLDCDCVTSEPGRCERAVTATDAIPPEPEAPSGLGRA